MSAEPIRRPCINCHQLEDQEPHLTKGCAFRPGPVLFAWTLTFDAYRPIRDGSMTFVILPDQPELLEGDQLVIRGIDYVGHLLPAGVKASAGVVCRGEEWNLGPGVMVVQLAPPVTEGAAWKHRPYDQARQNGKGEDRGGSKEAN